jgi:hypothetical protein
MNKSRKIAIFLKAVPDNKNCFCYWLLFVLI